MRWNVSTLATSLLEFLPRMAAAIVIFLAFWIAGRLIERAVRRFSNRRMLDPDLMQFLEQTVSAVLLLLGGITALGTMGINVSALVAGLGLTGFALGFALKDAISNLLAGVLLLFYKPFQRNDRITVSNQKGTVTDINMRYTVLRDEGKKILVPNSKLFVEIVIVDQPAELKAAESDIRVVS